MEMMLNKIVPEGLPYRHSCEGPDDMVSQRKSTEIVRHYGMLMLSFCLAPPATSTLSRRTSKPASWAAR